MVKDYKYWAFVSYSQIDNREALWLHRSMERYRVPKGLVGRKTNRGHDVPRRVFPVFRDRDELPTAAHFGNMLETALRRSRYLVVICSPNAVKSRWVNEEILFFKSIGREDRIIYLIVDGEPNASDSEFPEKECFPEAARFRVDSEGEIGTERVEPIAADLRPGKDGRTNAKLKILAGVVGVGFDELARRDHVRKMRSLGTFSCLATVLLAVMTTLAILFLVEKNKAEKALIANYSLSAREALDDGKFGESLLYFDAARNLGSDFKGDPGFASAWAACRDLKDKFQTGRAVRFCAFSENSPRVVTQDDLGGIQVRDFENQTLLWESIPEKLRRHPRQLAKTPSWDSPCPRMETANSRFAKLTLWIFFSTKFGPKIGPMSGI